MVSGEGFTALAQDPAKTKQKRSEIYSWNIKLQTLKAGLSITESGGTQAQEAVPITRTGQLMCMKKYNPFVLSWAAPSRSQVRSVSRRKWWETQEPSDWHYKRTAGIGPYRCGVRTEVHQGA